MPAEEIPLTCVEGERAPIYTLRQLIAYMLRLGTIGFGGPVALVGYMHRDLVEQRHWITDAEYKEGLTLAQLAPGPLAAQLGIYLGYVHYGVFGATLAGVAFVLPSFLMVLVIGWAYVRYGGLPWMQSLFYGVGAAVIGIIAYSAFKLTKRTIRNDRLLWAIFIVSGLVTIVTESEIVWLFFAAGFLVWLVRTPPKWLRNSSPTALYSLAPIWGLQFATTTAPAALILNWTLLGQIAGFFTIAGAFVFGSGLAIVPFLYGGVVKEYGWLNDQQFIDAVAVAMITPGPVVITVGFIGYLIAGVPGACVAALAVFLPCYLLTIIPAPYFKKHGKRPGIVAVVDGVTAAAIGAIAGAVFVLGQRSITDFVTAAISLLSLFVLWRFKIPEPLIVLAAATIGLVVSPMLLD
jgi:chromate transporter